MSSKTEASHPVVRAVTSVSHGLNIGATAALVLMMLISVVDVLARHTIQWAIPDSQEMVEYTMICVGFWAMSWCAVRKAHVAVDLLVNRFKPRTQAVFDCFTYLLGLAFFAFVSWRTFLEAPIALKNHDASILLRIPTYPFYSALALGLAIMCLVMLTQFIQTLSKAIKG